MSEIQFTLNESWGVRHWAAISSSFQAKTIEKPPPKTSQMRKTCPATYVTIELSDLVDSFARAFFGMPTMTIKYV